MHDLAESIARYVTTVGSTTPLPVPPEAPLPQLAQLSPGPSYFANHETFRGLGEETAIRILLELLGRLEQQQAAMGIERVTTGVLHELLGDELLRDAIDVRWTPQRQLEGFLACTAQQIAFVDDGRFERLVDRSAIANTLLSQLVLPPSTGE